MRVKKDSSNITTILEKHDKTKEILIPCIDVVLVLSLGIDVPEINTTKAFLLKTGSAFMIHEGVWHYAPISLQKEEGNIFVVFRSLTADEDVYQVTLQKCFVYDVTLINN